jgi:hypothetical protein
MSILAGLDKADSMTAFARARANSEGTDAPAKPIIPQKEAPPVITEAPNPEIKIADIQRQEPIIEAPQKPVETSVDQQPTQIQVDPYEPLKSRLGERPLEEWLSEVDTTFAEREDLRRKAEVLEQKAKEQEEKLIDYEIKNSPEFQEKAIAPITQAEDDLLYLFSNSNEAINEGLKIWNDRSLDAKSKADQLKAFALEYNLPPLDVRRAYDNLSKVTQKAQEYAKNWEQTKKQLQQQALEKREQDRKFMEETTRRTYKTAAYKAESKLKDLGIPINGFDEAREAYLNVVESSLQSKPVDLETEAYYAMLGRAVHNSRTTLSEQLQRLATLEAGSRIDPKSSPKSEGEGRAASSFGIRSNPLSKHTGSSF